MSLQQLMESPSSDDSNDSLYRLPAVQLSSQQPQSPSGNAVPDSELAWTGSASPRSPLIGK